MHRLFSWWKNIFQNPLRCRHGQEKGSTAAWDRAAFPINISILLGVLGPNLYCLLLESSIICSNRLIWGKLWPVTMSTSYSLLFFCRKQYKIFLSLAQLIFTFKKKNTKKKQKTKSNELMSVVIFISWPTAEKEKIKRKEKRDASGSYLTFLYKFLLEIFFFK